MKKSLLFLISICTVTLLSGCGGGPSAPPVATHFSVTAVTTTATAGTPFNITVTALDASGGLVSTFNGPVAFTSSDAKAVLPVSGMLASGTGTFSVTMKTAGAQTITVTYATLTGSSPAVMVSASAPTQFSVVAPAT